MSLPSIPSSIVHQLFSQMADAHPDEFFKDLFVECSKGHFPKGFTYYPDRNQIAVVANNQISYHRLTDDLETDYEIVKNIFTYNLKLCNDDETQTIIAQKAKTSEDNVRHQFNVDKWKQIKDATIKKIMISAFAKQILALYPSEQTLPELIKLIEGAVAKKHISDHNIVIASGEIESIDNLEYDAEAKKFYVDYVDIAPSRKRSTGKSKK